MIYTKNKGESTLECIIEDVELSFTAITENGKKIHFSLTDFIKPDIRFESYREDVEGEDFIFRGQPRCKITLDSKGYNIKIQEQKDITEVALFHDVY